MVASCFSPIYLFRGYLRSCLNSAGLSSQSLDIDSHTTIHFWGPKPSSLLSQKPALLLIHGFGPLAIWQWRHQIQALAPFCDVYVPDLVFFGDSTTSSTERTEIFQAEAMGKLMQKVGVKRYSVMGTSYGGFVAYHMASMWPERIEKVVIASSAVNMESCDNEELLKKAKAERIEDIMLPDSPARLRVLIRMVLLKPPFFMPDFVLTDFLDRLYADGREAKLELLQGLTLGRQDTPKISPIKQEVLVVWGDQDQIFPLCKAIGLKELLGDGARLEVIKDTSHVPQVERPGKFNAIVKNFLCVS